MWGRATYTRAECPVCLSREHQRTKLVTYSCGFSCSTTDLPRYQVKILGLCKFRGGVEVILNQGEKICKCDGYTLLHFGCMCKRNS